MRDDAISMSFYMMLADIELHWRHLACSMYIQFPFNIWRTVVLHSDNRFSINIMLHSYVAPTPIISYKTSLTLAYFSSVPICGVDVPENAY